jgi:hypothetical protein
VQPLQRLRVFSGCDVTTGQRLVVRPQRDNEAISQINARLHSRIERRHGVIGFGEPASDLDLELGDSSSVNMRDPSKDITRPQAQSQSVRVVDNDGVLGAQPQD